MTTSKELVESALNLEEVDRIPFCPPFQGYWALNNCGITVEQSINNPKLSADAQLKAVDSCHFDAIETMWDWLLPVEAMGCKVKIPKFGTIPTVDPVIKDKSDIDKIKIPDFKDFYRLASAREITKILASKIGKDHYLMATLAAPFTLAGELCGADKLMMNCVLDPDYVVAAVNLAIEVDKILIEELGKWDIDAIILCDPTASGDMISGEDYSKIPKMSMKEAGIAVKKAGKVQIDHICGNTSDRLETVADTGCKAFSLDWQVDIAKAVAEMDGKMAIIGNMNPSGFLYSGKPETVRPEVKRLAVAGGKRGYLFGAGCDIPVGSPFENVKCIQEVLEKI